MGGFSYTHAEAVQITADNCASSAICGTAPKYFTLLLGFVSEMMNSIKTIGTEWNYIGKYVNPNRYEGNVFVPPKTNPVSALMRNATQKLTFGVATLAVATSWRAWNFWGFKDIWWSVALLAKNKVFLRDNKLVETLESQLSDKKLELSLGGWWFVSVNPANRAMMQGIIQKYIDNWLLVDGIINPDASYDNVLSLVTQVLSSAKTILYFDTVSQFDDLERWWRNGTIRVAFNTANIATIQKEYSCARGFVNPCDSSLKSFTYNIQAVWSKGVGATTGSVQVITDAFKRLKQTFFIKSSSASENEKFKAREADLLNSMYGTQKANNGTLKEKLGKLIVVKYNEDTVNTKETVQSVNQGVNQSAEDITQFVSSVWQAATSMWTYVTDFATSKKSLESAKKNENIIIKNPSQWEEVFKNYLNVYLQDVFDQQALDSELATFAEVKPITPAFTILSQQIATIENKILWGKHQAWSLIKNLWEACELQCGKWWLCWY